MGSASALPGCPAAPLPFQRFGTLACAQSTVLPVAIPKEQPSGPGGRGHFRLRHDTIDSRGAMTLRRAGRQHHLNIGAAHARQRVLAIAHEHKVTVVTLYTGEVLSTHRIEPDKGYWRNQRRDPG
jgi:hypothetical protein